MVFAPSNLQSALFLRSSTFVHFIERTVNISVSGHLGREQSQFDSKISRNLIYCLCILYILASGVVQLPQGSDPTLMQGVLWKLGPVPTASEAGQRAGRAQVCKAKCHF